VYDAIGSPENNHMALVIGDLHGNLAKAQAFLNYEPDVEHICLGDYVDSFTEAPERQLECLKLLIDSDAVLLWGNHDIHYLPNSPWICSGFQPKIAGAFKEIFSDAFEKGRIMAAYAVDEWLCTHAGVHPYMTDKPMKPAQAAEALNQAFHDQLHEGRGPLFYVSPGRGGSNLFGGLFWFDPFREGVDPCEQVGRQVFGHTERKEPHVTDRWACIDTTNALPCWVFDTLSGKAFMIPYLT
jgi:hypothetical protein